ncbi:MFS transporter [Halegenticoccus soli]|uniref:MFS transporter n=1 Tax=Halegenticoccus soli TaxID=1985678 RepID=UPI000C6DE25C|nr:MFS transporter [Halegenticoccus soli]
MRRGPRNHLSERLAERLEQLARLLEQLANRFAPIADRLEPLANRLAPFAGHYGSLRHLRDPRLALLGAANLLDKSSTSIVVPLLPLYAERLGAGPILLGLVFALPTAVSALLSAPAGYVGDRLARKPLIVAGTALSAVGVVGLAFVSDPRWLLAFRAVDGVGSAMRTATTTAYLGDLADDGSRGSVMGAYQTLGMLSVALGPALGGTIVGASTLSAPFLVLGGLTALGSLALLRLPGTERTGNASNSEAIRSLSASDLRLRAAATPTVLALAVSAAVSAVGTDALNPLLAPLLRATVGAGPSYVSFAWGCLGIGLALFVPVGGSLADRGGRKRGLVVGKALWAAVAVGLVVGGHPLAPPALLALGGVASALSGPALGALRYETAPSGSEGAFVGLYGSLGAAGATAGPLLGAVAADAFAPAVAVVGVGLLWGIDALVVAAFVSEAQPSDGAR